MYESLKRVCTVFFLTLGVIFFILILIGVGVFLFRDQLFGVDTPTDAVVPPQSATSSSETRSPTTTNTIDTGVPVTPSQQEALNAWGIDPASLDATLTPDRIACFVSILGAERVAEIKAGAVPSPMEFFKVQTCL